jgi:hypothetical protein
LNLRMQKKKAKPVHLHEPYVAETARAAEKVAPKKKR